MPCRSLDTPGCVRHEHETGADCERRCRTAFAFFLHQGWLLSRNHPMVEASSFCHACVSLVGTTASQDHRGWSPECLPQNMHCPTRARERRQPEPTRLKPLCFAAPVFGFFATSVVIKAEQRSKQETNDALTLTDKPRPLLLWPVYAPITLSPKDRRRRPPFQRGLCRRLPHLRRFRACGPAIETAASAAAAAAAAGDRVAAKVARVAGKTTSGSWNGELGSRRCVVCTHSLAGTRVALLFIFFRGAHVAAGGEGRRSLCLLRYRGSSGGARVVMVNLFFCGRIASTPVSTEWTRYRRTREGGPDTPRTIPRAVSGCTVIFWRKGAVLHTYVNVLLACCCCRPLTPFPAPLKTGLDDTIGLDRLEWLRQERP